MAVPVQTPLSSSIANGVTTVFPYGFLIFKGADLSVTVNGVVQTLGIHYTVSGIGNQTGGNVTFTAAPANGATVVRRRRMAYSRDVDYQFQGDFLAAEVNPDQDAPVMMIQQLALDQQASIKIPDSLIGVFNPTLPAIMPLGPLVANAAGTGFEFGSTTLTGDMLLRPNLAAPTGASLVVFTQAGTGAVSRTVQDRGRDTVSALDFMTEAQKADVRSYSYTIDVTSAILTAVAAMALRGGGAIDFPAGGYRISSEISINNSKISIRGAGRDATVIRQYTPSAVAFKFNGPGYCGLSGMKIEYPVPGTVGALGIYSIGPYNTFSDFEVSQAYTAVYGVGGVATRLENFTLSNFVNVGLGLESTIDVFVRGGVIAGAPAAATGLLLIGNIEALNVTDCDVLFCTRSLDVQAPSFVLGNRLNPSYNTFTNCYFDSSSQGARIYRMVECDFTACWFSGGRSGAGFPGVTIEESHNIRFNGGKAVSCGSHGVFLKNSSKYINFSGFSACNNSVTSGSNAADGINIESGSTDFTIIGGACVNNLPGALQRYGISIPANSDRYIVSGVNLASNLSGGMLDLSTGTNRAVGGNIGYVNPIIGPTFQNAWVNFDAGGASGNSQAGYWKDQDGIVRLQGLIKSGTVASPAFTLPVGFRPTSQHIFSVSSNSLHGEVYVKPDGTVIPQIGSNVNFSLAGIQFRAV